MYDENYNTVAKTDKPISIRLSDVKDIEDIYQKWEDKIDEARDSDATIVAQINYDSMLAKNIIIARQKYGSTLAEKIAKGYKEVMDAKKNLNEKERRGKAIESQIKFLESLRNYRKFMEEYNLGITGHGKTV